MNKKPCAVIGLDSVFVNRVACGSSHSVAWCLPQSTVEEDKKEPVPFSSTKDPLGSNGLGIYDQEPPQVQHLPSKTTKQSLSTILLSLESLLGESEAKGLLELLKLSVAGRTGPGNTSQTIANTLIALGTNSTAIGSMIIETCITELEDLCTSRHFLGKIPKPVVQETSHPYIDDIALHGKCEMAVCLIVIVA